MSNRSIGATIETEITNLQSMIGPAGSEHRDTEQWEMRYYLQRILEAMLGLLNRIEELEK